MPSRIGCTVCSRATSTPSGSSSPLSGLPSPSQEVFSHYQDPHVYMSLSGAGRAGTFAVLQVCPLSHSKEGIDGAHEPPRRQQVAHRRRRLSQASAERRKKRRGRSVRNQRASALQTREQFIFVWLALTHHVLQHPVRPSLLRGSRGRCRRSSSPATTISGRSPTSSTSTS